jgi:hypothetical protein
MLESMKASAFFYLLVCFLFWPADAGSVRANQKPCSMAIEEQALGEVYNLKDWKDLYRSFIRFPHCDAGVIADGYSDTVGRLLAREWAQISILGKFVALDDKFESFVLRHIDENLPADMLITIANNASKSCPATETVLCGKIVQRSKQASHARAEKLREEIGTSEGTRVD